MADWIKIANILGKLAGIAVLVLFFIFIFTPKILVPMGEHYRECENNWDVDKCGNLYEETCYYACEDFDLEYFKADRSGLLSSTECWCRDNNGGSTQIY